MVIMIESCQLLGTKSTQYREIIMECSHSDTVRINMSNGTCTIPCPYNEGTHHTEATLDFKVNHDLRLTSSSPGSSEWSADSAVFLSCPPPCCPGRRGGRRPGLEPGPRGGSLLHAARSWGWNHHEAGTRDVHMYSIIMYIHMCTYTLKHKTINIGVQYIYYQRHISKVSVIM